MTTKDIFFLFSLTDFLYIEFGSAIKPLYLATLADSQTTLSKTGSGSGMSEWYRPDPSDVAPISAGSKWYRPDLTDRNPISAQYSVLPGNSWPAYIAANAEYLMLAH